MKLPFVLSLTMLFGASIALAQNTPVAPAGDAPTTQADAKAPASDMKITVLKVGENPAELRMKPVAGTDVTLTVTTKMSMTTKMGDNALPAQSIPTLVMTLKQSVKSVDPDGTAHCKVTFTAFQVKEEAGDTPGIGDMINNMMKGLINLSGDFTISDRGISSPVNWVFGPDVAPMIRSQMESMSQSMDQFSLPLPKEAIGEGGQWKIVGQIDTQGIKLEQTRTVTLNKRNQSILDLTIDVSQTAKPQDVSMPGGQKMHVDNMSATGTGQVTVDLAMLGATSGMSEVKSHSKMEIEAGPGGKQTLVQDASITVKIDTAPSTSS